MSLLQEFSDTVAGFQRGGRRGTVGRKQGFSEVVAGVQWGGSRGLVKL